MNSLAIEAQKIVTERGMNITQADVEEIDRLLFQIDFGDDEGQHAAGMVMEGVWLIVNDPAYAGDAQPLD